MKKTRNLIECLYKFVESIDDNDLKKLCDGEYSIVLDKGKGETSKYDESGKTVNHIKVVKTVKVDKKLSVDVSRFEELHKEILACNSRDEAKKILESSGFRKCDLFDMGDFLDVKIPKSYNKGKIISRLVEDIVGNKIDDNSIC